MQVKGVKRVKFYLMRCMWWLHGHTQPDDASVPLGSNPTSLAGRQGLLCYTVLSGLKFKSHFQIYFSDLNGELSTP